MKRVLILDDDEDLTFLLAALFNEEGAGSVVAHSLDELQKKKDEAFLCQLAILDINLGVGGPSGIDACQWLLRSRFPGKIVFLTGHAESNPLCREANKIDGIPVIEKPTDVSNLLSYIGGAS